MVENCEELLVGSCCCRWRRLGPNVWCTRGEQKLDLSAECERM